MVAKTLRDALLSGYRRIGLEQAIPEVISGHALDGSPSRTPHLAIVPLAFSGFPHADGHVMGFALIPPRTNDIFKDEAFRRALRTLAPIDEQYGRRILTLTTRRGAAGDTAFSIGLSPSFEPPVGKRSLDPELYTKAARTFATVTPILLDRHLKAEGSARYAEIATQVVSACRNIGLPDPVAIVPHKHPSIEGVPSAYPSGNSPAWNNWRLPPSLATRQLTHAVIRFAEPIEGPVILGAGRFLGLGLCRPLRRERE
jgi:CRISPR-associated protein Csb2